jgi:hypothetical protein
VLDHPAVVQLSSDDLEQLMLIALAKRADDDLELLCRDTAANSVRPAAIGRLFAAAVQLNSSVIAVNSLLMLEQLYGADVTLDDLLPFIRAAVYTSSSTCRTSQQAQRIIRHLPRHLVSMEVLPEVLRMV